MNLEYKHLLDSNFHPDSKVWIYQGSRQFLKDEAETVKTLLKEFVAQWESHGAPVKGAAYLFFNQFIIFMADTTDDGICGRSTDSSMRFIKNIEQKFSINMFERTTMAFVVTDKVELFPLDQLQNTFEKGFINGETFYFNNLVSTKKELENDWIIPVKKSWLTRKISLHDPVS